MCPLPRAPARAALPDTRSEGVGCLERAEVTEAAQRFERRPAARACARARAGARACARARARTRTPAPAHVGGHLLVERLGR
jgi:hypothetical protein